MKNKKSVFRWLLIPIAAIYALVMYIRNTLFDLNILPSKSFNIPIISVGNITVGGTGKTPHIEYLIRLLKTDFDVATLSRGYKRKSSGFVLADENSQVKDIGDEPMQFKQKFPDIDVAVDANRVRGVQKLIDTTDPDIILLDDAFQHRHIEAGLNILLIDFNRQMYHDNIIPVGQLRESRHEKRRAGIILITKTPADIKPIEQRIIDTNLKLFPFQHLYFTTFEYGDLVPLFKANSKGLKFTNCTKNDCDFLLVTGISQPHQLLEHLKQFSNDIKHVKFADHHNFSKKDIAHITRKFEQIKASKKYIITTEKDAMRLKNMSSLFESETILQSIYYLPIKVKFLNNAEEDFEKHILNYVRKDVKPHKKSHKRYY